MITLSRSGIERLALSLPTYPAVILDEFSVSDLTVQRCDFVLSHFRFTTLNVLVLCACYDNIDCFLWRRPGECNLLFRAPDGILTSSLCVSEDLYLGLFSWNRYFIHQVVTDIPHSCCTNTLRIMCYLLPPQPICSYPLSLMFFHILYLFLLGPWMKRSCRNNPPQYRVHRLGDCPTLEEGHHQMVRHWTKHRHGALLSEMGL